MSVYNCTFFYSFCQSNFYFSQVLLNAQIILYKYIKLKLFWWFEFNNRIIYHLWSISIWNTYKPCPIQRLIGNLKFKMCTALFETKILQTNSYFKNKQNSD